MSPKPPSEFFPDISQQPVRVTWGVWAGRRSWGRFGVSNGVLQMFKVDKWLWVESKPMGSHFVVFVHHPFQNLF